MSSRGLFGTVESDDAEAWIGPRKGKGVDSLEAKVDMDPVR